VPSSCGQFDTVKSCFRHLTKVRGAVHHSNLLVAAMSETEMARFKEVTLHPGSKLITRLPRAFSFVFSPYWYPEPFFIRNRLIVY
jgi:hypothetical protein